MLPSTPVRTMTRSAAEETLPGQQSESAARESVGNRPGVGVGVHHPRKRLGDRRRVSPDMREIEESEKSVPAELGQEKDDEDQEDRVGAHGVSFHGKANGRWRQKQSRQAPMKKIVAITAEQGVHFAPTGGQNEAYDHPSGKVFPRPAASAHASSGCSTSASHIYFLLGIVGIWSAILSFITFWVVLFTGKFPESIFNFQIGYHNWTLRVEATLANLVDGYPAFFPSGKSDTVSLEVPRPEKVSRGLVILRLLFGVIYVGIPHVFCLVFRFIGTGVLGFLAWFAILFAGTYPARWHAFNVGTYRWLHPRQSLPGLFHRRVSEVLRQGITGSSSLRPGTVQVPGRTRIFNRWRVTHEL